jgi:hypothetical protein
MMTNCVQDIYATVGASRRGSGGSILGHELEGPVLTLIDSSAIIVSAWASAVCRFFIQK